MQDYKSTPYSTNHSVNIELIQVSSSPVHRQTTLRRLALGFTQISLPDFRQCLTIFNVVKNIPNAFTLINLLSGFAGIIFLFNEQSELVVVCCAIALLADMADGMLARMLNAASELGTQLDSFADLVSFGVLPGCTMVYLWHTACGNEINIPVIITASLIPLGTTIRLARFNLDTRDRTTFYGLPSPGSGLFVFGLLLVDVTGNPDLSSLLCAKWFHALVCIALPAAMLSNLRLWSLKGLSLRGGRVILASLLLLSVIFFIFFNSFAVVLTVLAYLLFGLLNLLLRLY